MRRTVIFILLSLLFCIDGFSKNTINVMSFNIRQNRVDDGINSWDNRKNAVVAMLNDIAPDVMGVQEAYRDQVNYIARHCPEYQNVGWGRENGHSKGEHTSIFYNANKFKLVKKGMFWLSETPNTPSIGWDAKYKRTATWIVLKSNENGKEFLIVNTHLDNRGIEAKRLGLRMICDWIEDNGYSDLPYVLMGDFNTRPTDEILDELNSRMSCARLCAQVADQIGSFSGYGKRDVFPIIDYIYYTGFDACRSFKVNTHEYDGTKYISDHYPIYAVLEY